MNGSLHDFHLVITAETMNQFLLQKCQKKFCTFSKSHQKIEFSQWPKVLWIHTFAYNCIQPSIFRCILRTRAAESLEKVKVTQKDENESPNCTFLPYRFHPDMFIEESWLSWFSCYFSEKKCSSLTYLSKILPTSGFGICLSIGIWQREKFCGSAINSSIFLRWVWVLPFYLQLTPPE